MVSQISSSPDKENYTVRLKTFSTSSFSKLCCFEAVVFPTTKIFFMYSRYTATNRKTRCRSGKFRNRLPSNATVARWIFFYWSKERYLYFILIGAKPGLTDGLRKSKPAVRHGIYANFSRHFLRHLITWRRWKYRRTLHCAAVTLTLVWWFLYTKSWTIFMTSRIVIPAVNARWDR